MGREVKLPLPPMEFILTPMELPNDTLEVGVIDTGDNGGGGCEFGGESAIVCKYALLTLPVDRLLEEREWCE